MNPYLTLRTFIAVFLTLFGIGLIFVPPQDERMMIGAAIAAIGITFLLRMRIELRQQ